MRVEKSSPTVFTPLDDRTGVLLNLETLSYYRLNRTGVVVWREIEKTDFSTIDDLVRATCERFDVSEYAARREIGTFVEMLEQFKLVRLA